MANRYYWMLLLLAVRPAAAQDAIVVDHSGNRTSWRISDTASGESYWQLTADDIILDSARTIRHVTWWGLYYSDSAPTAETMRIRFYDPRPGDGLPGNVLFEESVSDPFRTATGAIIPGVPPGTSLTAVEYRFEADLPKPISLLADTPYWLEVAQVGSPETTFGWRGASIDQTGRAVINPTYGDWLHADGFDMAFQLSTIPEPGTAALLALGISLSRRWSSNVICATNHLPHRRSYRV